MQTINKYLYYITIFITSLAILASLPNINVQINDDYKFEWIGLSTLGLSENLFNFSKGKGIYPEKRVEATATTSESIDDDTFIRTYDRDKNVIMSRLAIVNGLLNSDMAAHEYLDDDRRSFVFDYPDYINSSDSITRALVSRGDVEIVFSSNLEIPDTTNDNSFNGSGDSILSLYFPGYQPLETEIDLSKITNFNVDTSSLINAPILRTTFNSESAEAIDFAFANSSYDQSGNPIFPIIMMIDDFPEFWAFPTTLFSGISATETNQPIDLIWIPLFEVDRTNIAVKAATIFGGDNVNLNYEFSDVQEVSPTYAPDGANIILASLATFFAGLVVFVAYRYGIKYSFYYSVGLGSFLLTSVAFSKLLGTAIDNVMIITFSVLSVYISIALIRILNAQKEILEKILTDNLYLSAIIFLIASTASQIPISNLLRGYEIMIVISIVWVISSLIYFRGVAYMYLSDKSNNGK